MGKIRVQLTGKRRKYKRRRDVKNLPNSKRFGGNLGPSIRKVRNDSANDILLTKAQWFPTLEEIGGSGFRSIIKPTYPLECLEKR